MAVNLTPQYLEAEAEYKKAQTADERLACLKKMWALVPKHKASEKLQAELKTKLSDWPFLSRVSLRVPLPSVRIAPVSLVKEPSSW